MKNEKHPPIGGSGRPGNELNSINIGFISYINQIMKNSKFKFERVSSLWWLAEYQLTIDDELVSIDMDSCRLNSKLISQISNVASEMKVIGFSFRNSYCNDFWMNNSLPGD